jgi:hypothetical protein
MDQIDDPSSSDINNNDEIEIDEVVSGPQNIQESRLDTNETAGSLWRYFFKPENPGQARKSLVLRQEVSSLKEFFPHSEKLEFISRKGQDLAEKTLKNSFFCTTTCKILWSLVC